jgi:hypothetical protein
LHSSLARSQVHRAYATSRETCMAVGTLDTTALVQVISKGVQQLVPLGVAIGALEGQLLVTTPKGTDYLQIGRNIELLMQQGEHINDALTIVALEMLNELQDIVSVALAEPWPRPSFSSPRSEFATPYAEVRNDTLHLWYGDGSLPSGDVRIDVPLAR